MIGQCEIGRVAIGELLLPTVIPPTPTTPTDTRTPKVPWYPNPYATYGFGGAAALRKQGIIRQRNER